MHKIIMFSQNIATDTKIVMLKCSYIFITLVLVINSVQLSVVQAFSSLLRHQFHSPRQLVASSCLVLHAGSSSCINHKIDLDSSKITTIDKLISYDSSKGGDNNKEVYCRCWQSNTFPSCDGAHAIHNKLTGDNVGPLIVSVAEPTGKKNSTAITNTNVLILPKNENRSASISGWAKKVLFFQRETDVNDNGDGGLTTRERLAKMGLSALLSYGWVSNMSYAVTLSLSWYGFSKKTGMSPLAPGQWKPYLAVYAGFYVVNNFLRPFRLGLSVIISKYFDSFINWIQTKTNLSRKWSIGVVVFLANVCGTLSAVALGVLIASTASGVPLFPVPSHN